MQYIADMDLDMLAGSTNKLYDESDCISQADPYDGHTNKSPLLLRHEDLTRFENLYCGD